MTYYIKSTVAVLSRCSYKLGSKYTGVYAVVRMHAHFMGILCACAHSFLCAHALCIYQARMGAQGDLQIKLN